MLVNDLWAAGAEAISIGGVRLQPRSAIRQAGGSILVDNSPVFWPITIEAIGDPAGMQVKSVRNTFTKADAFRFPPAVALDIAKQFKCQWKNDPVALALFGGKDSLSFVEQA